MSNLHFINNKNFIPPQSNVIFHFGDANNATSTSSENNIFHFSKKNNNNPNILSQCYENKDLQLDAIPNANTTITQLKNPTTNATTITNSSIN